MASFVEEDLLCDGELEVLPITDSLHDTVLEFYKNDFIRNENICKALNIAGSELSLAEVEPIVRVIVQDNLGYLVRHTQTKETVAMCINAILHPSTDLTLNFEFQSPTVVRASEIFHQIKGSFDMFKEWNVDCAMEIVFLSTRKDFGGRNLATLLSERSIRFAQQMLTNTLDPKVKNALPESVREQRPQAVCSIFTSIFTQKIGEKLNFETFVEIPYSEIFYEGKSLAELIEPIHKSVKYTGKKL